MTAPSSTHRRVALVGIAVLALLLAGFEIGYRVVQDEIAPEPPPEATAGDAAHPSLLYGRVTTTDGHTYLGRIRWGGDQEAFWTDCFNGRKDENPWASFVPRERLVNLFPVQVFGIDIMKREVQIDLNRSFMARFGDLRRIESRGSDILLTTKSGTVFNTDFHSFNDFDDGVRVWDSRRGVIDLRARQMTSIDLLPAPDARTPPHRLYGTVRTRSGEFTGFIGWNRDSGLGSDGLYGRADSGELVSVRFDTIRTIARGSSSSGVELTLADGRSVAVSGTRDSGDGDLCLYVDHARFGRVLICWNAFERVDFAPAAPGPTYDDFPAGAPIRGSVTTRAGQRLAGRIVYDLDESETTETFDAPARGVTYNIPFGLIGSIALPVRDAANRRAQVRLHGGETLEVEMSGDLGESNGGVLVFADGDARPRHVAWTDVARLDLDRPLAMYPPLPPR